MKFIHTADLHLGARNEAKLSPDRAKLRRAELLATFERIAELAEREEAAVLIAGDLFDTSHPTRRTVGAVIATIRRHPTVRFFCLPGNHDGGEFPSDDIPENLSLFGKELTHYTVGDVDIYGTTETAVGLYDALRPDPDRKNVLLLHGAVKEGGTPEAGTVVLSRLAERGIDYLALGHYHLHRVTSLDTRGVCAYSGTPEGRGMDEAGECGVLLIDTAESPIRPRFIKTARRTIHRFPVEVTADAAETERRIRDALAGIPREDIVRIELSGRIPPDAPRPNAERIVDVFGRNHFYLEVRDHTRLDIRPEQYADSLTLKGEFVRRVMAAGLSEAEQDAILQAGLAALRGEEDEV